ncbi:DUF6428 family protein [Lacinutrix sp.]|uniref:DUF6428 family protein n=1 Tax=Lacinutrix sp. TaxID=1937692 RepID=UPI0025C02A46|nr:DUF6428 family protein [Lacinutrix sp.]
MTTQDFLSLIAEHQDKALLFEYAPKKYAGTNYHITEVKHITVDSVDCGGQVDAWKETIIQLWESPLDILNTKYMSAYKALAILKKVGTMKPYTLDAEVKFEYSNSTFHTAQLFVNDFVIQDQNLIIKLGIEKTACKALDICGIVDEVKDKVESCCTPDSGCC